MELDLPVFERRNVKRIFYYFLAFNFAVSILTILLVALTSDNIPGNVFVSNNYMPIMVCLVLFSYIFTSKSKKDLKTILNTPDFNNQVVKYESYYRKKIFLSGASLVITAFLFIMTTKNIFFYILIFQLLLSFVFFPTKKLISKALNNNENIFK
jgi:hypothetical protein